MSALQLLTGVVGRHEEVATHASTADMWVVAKLTVVWAGQAGMSLGGIVAHRAALPAFSLV